MDTDNQTIEHANYNPVDYFRNRVRDWWYQVLETEKKPVPPGTALAAEKTALLAKAKNIRQYVEKLPGMGNFFRAENLDGVLLPIVGLAAAAVASVIGWIKIWEHQNQAFNHKMKIYEDSRAIGYSPEQSAQLAVGVQQGGFALPKWLIYAPWIVIGVGAGYWFFFKRGSGNE